MGTTALVLPALPTSMKGFNETVRIKHRRTLLAGYKMSYKGKRYLSLMVWNVFYQLAVKSIPDDFYDWQDDALDVFLEEKSSALIAD